MLKKIKKILDFSIYPYLIGIFYFVYKLSFAPVEFDWIVCLLYFSFFGFSTFFSILFFKKKVHFLQIPVLVSVCWIAILFHGNIISGLKIIFNSYNNRYKYVWTSAFIVAIIFSFLSNRLSKYNVFLNRAANTFFLLLILISGMQTLIQYGKAELRVMSAITKNNKIARIDSVKKDIVWILMDEYASSEVLKRRFDFVNPLDSVLQKKGFALLPNIKSRTNLTMYSLNSIFNFDDSTEPYGLKFAAFELEKSALPVVLKKNGYQFKSLSFFNIGDEKQVEKLYTYHQTLIFQLIQGTIPDILLQNYFRKLYLKLFYYQKNILPNYNGFVYDHFIKEIKAPKTEPVFLWAHFLIPHGPLFKFEHGVLKPIIAVDSVSVKKGYIEYLKYGNYLLEKILNENPQLMNKIVIISGDHGIRLGYIESGDDRMKPYFAIHFPRSYDTLFLKKLKYISEVPSFLLKN
jgi:hypothetical protein